MLGNSVWLVSREMRRNGSKGEMPVTRQPQRLPTYIAKQKLYSHDSRVCSWTRRVCFPCIDNESGTPGRIGRFVWVGILIRTSRVGGIHILVHTMTLLSWILVLESAALQNSKTFFVVHDRGLRSRLIVGTWLERFGAVVFGGAISVAKKVFVDHG